MSLTESSKSEYIEKYEDIRSSLKTGDIVLFSGNKGIAPFIRLCTRSKWTHVGMVYKRGEDIFLWESTKIGKVVDSEMGKKINGVQLPLLSERIRRFPGEVAIRPISREIDEDMVRKLYDFRQKVKGKKYDNNTITLLMAAYDGIFIPEEFVPDASNDLSSFFCSELIAATYQKIGLIPSKPPPSEYTPADFSEHGKVKLMKGYELGKEKLVKWNNLNGR